MRKEVSDLVMTETKLLKALKEISAITGNTPASDIKTVAVR